MRSYADTRASRRNYGPTTDQLRTTTAMDTSEQWFTLDNRGGPIWGTRAHEFKSRGI
jgi:hypothetical protein